ncbi:hypothetical protein [uncultured Microbulbifer sp.]|uniref:hypothetical protein n=1 Tax=uncultured Microbulbifer sp. TaxID=348147 RepID=UPI0026021917|nr:hypothetical protein [uncultured Microbulbifer sp.]
MTSPEDTTPPNAAEKRQKAERDLIDSAREAMLRRDQSLDGETLSQLRRARSAALDSKPGTGRMTPWFTAGLAGTAGVVVTLAVLVWPGGDTQQAQPVDLFADAWILDEEAELELIEDVEFYQWLAEEGSDGHSS